MFSLEVKLIAAIGLAVSLWAGFEWKLHEAKQQGAEECRVANLVAQQAADEQARLLANRAALRYEEFKMAQQPRVVTVTREVTRAVAAAPAWAAEPLPGGVRDAIAAAGKAIAAGEPDGAVPVPAAGGDDKRAAGGGLRLGAERLRGLFSPASGPR